MKRLLLLCLLSVSLNSKAILPGGSLLLPSVKVIVAATLATQYVYGVTKAAIKEALVESYRTKQAQEQK